MAENYFDQYDDDEDARPSAGQVTIAPFLNSQNGVRPQNHFDQYDNDPDAAHSVGGAGWADDLVSGISIDTARDSAKALTAAERRGLKVKPKSSEEEALAGITDEAEKKEASFFAAFEHGLKDVNALAYADTLDHLALMSGDPSYQRMYKRWAASIRDAFDEDGSSYESVYKSYKDVHGMADAWGYIKESAGRNIGTMMPSIIGGIGGAMVGGYGGEKMAGKTGARMGAVVGGLAGATVANVHLQVSDMRNALMSEDIDGEQLAAWTNYGAAVLVSLDSVMPGLVAAKIGSRAVSQRIASGIAKRLIAGGTLRTPAEFVRRFGTEIVKDGLIETVTELTQQGITDFVPKAVADKPITKEDVEKYVFETSPEVILQTLITVGAVSSGPSALHARRQVREGRELADIDRTFPMDRPGFGEDEEGDVPRETSRVNQVLAEEAQKIANARAEHGIDEPVEAPGVKAMDVIQFIRNLGGIQPSGELEALDARRYPGLVSAKGMHPDKVREAMVEAGYLIESGPDEPAITSIQDVFDAIGRSMGGERVVPIADQEADKAFFANKEAKEAEALLADMESTRIFPELARIDKEGEGNYFSEAYSKLAKSDRDEVIERHVRKGENLDDLIEEKMIYSGNPDDIAALAVRHGVPRETVEGVRRFVEDPKTQKEAAGAIRTLGGLIMAAQVHAQRTSRAEQAQAANYHPGALTYGELAGMPQHELARQAAAVGVQIPSGASKETAIKAMREAYANQPEGANAQELGRAVATERTMGPTELADQLILARDSARGAGEIGAARWRQEGARLASRITQMSKADALETFDRFMGRDPAAEEKISRETLADAVARVFDDKMAAPVATGAPLPTRVPGAGEVAITPLAQARYERLKAAVRQAVKSVLPPSASIEMLQRIDLRAKLNETRYALARVASRLPQSKDRRKFVAKGGETFWLEKTLGDDPGHVTFGIWSDAQPELGDIGEVDMLFQGLGNEKIHGHTRPRYEVSNLRITPAFRRRGIAGAAYDQIEKMLGIKMEPSGTLLSDGYEFWRNRNPQTVTHHQWSSAEKAWVSPRYVRQNIKFYENMLNRDRRSVERLHRKAMETSLASVHHRYAAVTGWPVEIFTEGSEAEIADVLRVSGDWGRAISSPDLMDLYQANRQAAAKAAAASIMRSRETAEEHVQKQADAEQASHKVTLTHFKALWAKLPKPVRAQDSLDRMFMLAGVKAANAPLGSKMAAERMENRGTPAASIWVRTGWARGPDGLWRFEIDDSQARILDWESRVLRTEVRRTAAPRRFLDRLLRRAPSILSETIQHRRIGEWQTNIPLTEFLDHPKLFAAYPFLRQMRVSFRYDPAAIEGFGSGELMFRKQGNKTIYRPIQVVAGTPQEAVSTLLHEIQHYIQRHEGFAFGSDVPAPPQEREGKPGRKQRPPLYDAHYYYAAGESEFWRTHRSLFDGAPHVEDVAAMLLDYYDMERNGITDVGKQIERFEDQLEELLRVPPDGYVRSFGEYEAYRVEQRINLNEADRRQFYPFADMEGRRLVASRFQTRNYQDAYDEIMRRAQIKRDIRARWATRRDVGGGVSAIRDTEDHTVYFYGENPDDAILSVSHYAFIAGAEASLSERFLAMPYAEQRRVMDLIDADVRRQNMRLTTDSWKDQRAFEFWKRYDPAMIAFDPRLYREQLTERAVAEYGPGAVVVFDGDPIPDAMKTRFPDLGFAGAWDLDPEYAHVVAPRRDLTAEELAEVAHEEAYAADAQAKADAATNEDQAYRLRYLRRAALNRIADIRQMAEGWPQTLDTRGIVPTDSAFEQQPFGHVGVDQELRYLAAADEAIARLGLDRDRRFSLARVAPDLDQLGYFSKALEAAKAMKQKSGPPAAMLAKLKNAGVKDAEIEGSGLKAFLDTRVNQSVTKEEIVDVLTAGRMRLSETLRGGSNYAVAEAKQRLRAFDATGEMDTQPTAEDIVRRAELYSDVRLAEFNDPRLKPAYLSHSVEPHNPTYVENVVYTPSRAGEVVRFGDVKHLADPNFRNTPDRNYVILRPDGSFFSGLGGVGIYSFSSRDDAYKKLRELSRAAGADDYFDEGHWREPNIVGWYRGQILRTAEGDKSFNGDEIQSDYGQSFRDVGLAVDRSARIEELRAKIAQLKQNGDTPLSRAYRTAAEFNADYAEDAYNTDRLMSGLSIFGSDYYGFEPMVREAFLAEFPEARVIYDDIQALDAKISSLRGDERLPEGDPRAKEIGNLQDEVTAREFDLHQFYAFKMTDDDLSIAKAELGLMQIRGKGVPFHPLITSTTQWASTVLRRMVRYAVMSGADGISLTPGFEQNLRWRRSVQLAEATVTPRADGGRQVVLFWVNRARGSSGKVNRLGQLDVDADGLITAASDSIPEFLGVKAGKSKLAGIVTPAAAEQIMAVKDKAASMKFPPRTEFGGRAFRETYDTLYPDILEKILRALDPSIKREKRIMRGFKVDEDYSKWPIFQDPWVYFPLTDKAREAVMRDGQPVYSVTRRAPEMPDPEAEAELQALGQADPYAGIISVAMDTIIEEAERRGMAPEALMAQTARHEALELFHGLGLFSDQEWKLLTRTAKRQGWVTPELRANYTELYRDTMTAEELEEVIIKEAIADKFASFLAGDVAIAQAEMKPGDKVVDFRIGELFNRLKDFLEKVANYARGMGFERWEQVFMKLERGEFAQRYERDVAGHTAKNLEGEIAGVVRSGALPDAPGFFPSPGATHPVIGLAEIIHEFRRTLGLPLAQGRLNPALARAARRRGSRLYGQYNFGTGVARVAVSNDFDTITHEGGHHMEARYGAELQSLMAANTVELGTMAAAIGYGSMDVREGFAEFFRKYVTNPQTAQAQAPSMYADFEAMLTRDDPQMLGRLQNLQNAYLAFLTGSPMDVKIANQTLLIGRETAFGRFMQEAEDEGLLDTIGDRMHWLYYSIIGRNHGWWMATKRLLDLIETRVGRRIDIRAMANPNVLIRRMAHTTSWALQDLKRGIALRRRPNGGGVSMHDVFRVAFGGTEKAQWNQEMMQKFGDYLISRRAVRLFVQHNPALRAVVLQYIRANPQLGFLAPAIPTNATSELEYAPTLEPLTHHLQALIQHTAENPQFGQAAALYQEFNHDILDFLYEKGLLSKEQRDALMIDNDYAPFQRDMSDRALNAGARTSQRPEVNGPLANKYGVYRSIHGSMRDIINPLQSTIQFVYEMRLRAAFNEVLQAMDKLATRAGNGGGEIFERLPAHEAQRHEVQIRETLRSAARGAGLSDYDTTAMLATVESYLGPNATAELFSLKQAGEHGERVVWFYENGKAIPAKLADGSMGLMMFEAFTTLGRRTPDLWMKLIGIPAATVRWGVTNAFEFIMRNLWVDAIASSVNSPFARPFLTQARGLREVFTGGEYFEMYNRYAGMMGGESVQSISDQSLDRDFETLRSQTAHIIRRPKGIWDFMKMVLSFGELSETATRVGVFRNAMIANERDGLTRYQAAYEAAHAAHDVMDFSRYGSKTELIRRATPFWGAATQGIDRYLRTLTGANDHGLAVSTWMKYQFGGRQLTPHEQRSLGQAGRAWFWTTMLMGGASAFFWWLGADDEDLDDIPDRIRATHWRVSIDGALYFIPKDFRSFLGISDEKHLPIRLPKPFEMTWVANAMERALDAAYKGDRSAALRYLDDFWTIVQPPDSIPALDLPYGFMHGKDDFAHRDIIPYWEQQLERADQYGPYTSELAKKIGSAVKISPYYIDYLVRGLGASVGRDAQTAYEFTHNWVTGTGPEPGIEEFPIARRFMYNVARSSESISKFYDIYRNQEGIVDWFWDVMSADARSYAAAKNSYARRKQDLNDPAGAEELYAKLSPDQKVYATLSVDFKGDDSEFRNLHPIENAAEGISVANNLMKEVLSGYVKTDVADEPIKLNGQQEHYLRNELGHIRRAMAQNALHILGVPGWANQKMADVDARFDVIKAANEPVYDELIRRLDKKHFLEMSYLQKVWPQVKARVLENRGEAALGDLVAGGEIGIR